MSEESTKMPVAETIRELVHISGLSNPELERRSGVPLGTIKSVKDGKSGNPGIFTIQKLVNALGLNLGEFEECCLYGIPEDYVRGLGGIIRKTGKK